MADPKRLRLFRALTALIALAVIGVGAFVVVTDEPSSTPRSATLSEAEGDVQGRPAGSTVSRTAPEGTRLSTGDAIRTAVGASAEIEYFDGSATRLDASTTVLIEEIASAPEGGGALITLNQSTGRTYHRFEGEEGSGGRFRVMTPASIVTVRGSEFTVTVEPGGSTAYGALDGNLSVLTLGGPVTVGENDGLEVSAAGAAGRPFPLPPEVLEDPWLANARCEAEDAEGATCPSADLPGEIVISPGATPSFSPPPIPGPSPGATVTPPEILPSPTPTRSRPSPQPSPTTTPSPPGPGPTAVPQTRITAAPARLTNESLASFGFSSTPRSASFQCRLDGGAWRGCSSPQSYGPLEEGRHRFTVRGLSSSGVADSTPAAFTWTIDRTRPETAIVDGPSGTTSEAQVTFRFRAAEGKLRFECSLDGSEFRVCSSPKSYEVSANGSHTFQVRATDRAGNVELTPAARTWQKT